MTAVELQLAIDRLKVDLTRSFLDDQQQEIRKKIVELQMKKQQIKDEEEEEVGIANGVWSKWVWSLRVWSQSLCSLQDHSASSSLKEIYGHKFLKQSLQVPMGAKRVCEGCGKKIRPVISLWYTCKCKPHPPVSHALCWKSIS